MRNALLALLVLASMPLLAQDRPRRLSVFISEMGFGYSEGGGSFFSGGLGAAFEMRFGQRLSVEGSVTREERSEVVTFIDFEGQTIRDRIDIEAMPVDVTARYHFRTPHIRWRPYAGLGVRWVQAPSAPETDLENRVSPQVIAGLDYNMTQAWSLRVDAKRLLRGDEAPHDPLMKIAVGVGYRF